MAQKHLSELLQEDQEPFLLKNYIADRICQIKTTPRTTIQIRKRKPISQTSSFSSNFCKNACFFSFNESPDPRKSPLFDIYSPKNKNPNSRFLYEAALRIQRNSKPNNRKNAFGLFGFGSIVKRLTTRSRTRPKVATREISIIEKPEAVCEQRMSCSCNGRSRTSSAVWSESNEETSVSGQSEDFELKVLEISDFDYDENRFCESPFHFVLQTSPSNGHRTPEFSSPVGSPYRRQTEQEKDNYETEKMQLEEEEDKEQNSPVSVLDPPFEDIQIEEEEEDEEENEDEQDSFDPESCFACVQRSHQQLLQRLRRFEKLAGLDPIELEKVMLEQAQDSSDGDDNPYDADNEQETKLLDESSLEKFVQLLLVSNFDSQKQVPDGMKRLVMDLVADEEIEPSCLSNREVIAQRVSRLMELWKEVEYNTIDMMIEQDYRKDRDWWLKNPDQGKEIVSEIEVDIVGSIVEELVHELVSLV